jgi:hypothetical protein
LFPQKPRQLCDIRRDPPRGQPVAWLRPIDRITILNSVERKMAIFKIRIKVRGVEPDTRPIYEIFYVVAPSRQEAIEAVRKREGVEVKDIFVLRELNENEVRQFRYLRSAEF